MARILCVLEHRAGALRKVSREVVAAGRRLADGLGGQVDAIVCAGGPVEGLDGLGAAGADRVLTATHPAFAPDSPDGCAATIAARAPAYAAVVLAATATGKDLAPRISAKLGRACAMDVTDLTVEQGAILATRPVYAGKALQRVRLRGAPAVLTIRPNVFAPDGIAKPGAVEAVEVPAFETRVTVREVKAAAAAALDVSEAPAVVSGGRGLKDPAHFKLIEDLAAALGNAAVGASRAVVDAGWRDHAAQVGQTGKTVSPSLYVAVGISGAIQHLAGMRTSKIIVAINRDKDAPIFKVADYGIVGDLFEVVPRLTEAIRALRDER